MYSFYRCERKGRGRTEENYKIDGNRMMIDEEYGRGLEDEYK
jgi:hypothetical protein